MQELMYRLLYYYENRLSESYDFPNKALCHWQLNQFRAAGTHVYGHFVIEKV
jgi:hypothetical protein